MTYLQAIALGLVQGIAEFLPISGSGHMRLFEKLLGLPNSDSEYLLFGVLLRLATLVAIIIVYHKSIGALLKEALAVVHLHTYRPGENPNLPLRRMLALLMISLLPLFLVLPVRSKLEALGDNFLLIGLMLLLTGIVLYFSDHIPRGKKTEKEMTLKDAIAVGFAQAIAALPGLSRPGCTVSAGCILGLSRSYAVDFSVIMSIPAVLAAIILRIGGALSEGMELPLLPKYLVGFVVAVATGVVALRFLQFLARRNRFGAIAYYCWGAGLVSMLLFLVS